MGVRVVGSGRRPWWLMVGAVIVVVALAVVVAGSLLRTRSPSVNLLADLPAGSWTDGAVVGDLAVVFAGGGRVLTQPDSEARLVLQPATVGEPATTLSALVASQASYSDACLSVVGRLQTQQQLRTGSAPNQWEVAWLVWDYSDNDHFMYALVKPDGWELGKRDPAYPGGQRFLATGEDVIGAIGAWHDLRVDRWAQPDASTRIVLSISGRQVADVLDRERPYQAGRVGVYTEDARVAAAELNVSSC